MADFKVPSRKEVSSQNQQIFDNLEKSIGFVLNMYAFKAHAPTALNDYLALQNRRSSQTAKEKEIINLVVSQVNSCRYCLTAHTVNGKMQGFTEEDIIDIRQTRSSFNDKLNVLIQLTK